MLSNKRLIRWLWVKTNGTIFRVGAAPILGPILVGIESDVHWGLTGLLTHGQISCPIGTPKSRFLG